MKTPRARNGWVGRIALLGSTCLLFLTSCISTNVVVSATEPQAQQTATSDEDDFSQLIAQLQADLNRQKSREVVRTPTLTPTTSTTKERNREFAQRAAALFAPLSGTALRMPVVGVRTYDLSDSWGNSRDGGRRKHRGIDIFARRGTPLVAVADGIVSYIGDQPKGGHCLWLTNESGSSFYYAHLDRWAPGLYEGMEVRSGDLLGYVGNTGNAATTPPHLHFAVNQNDEMVNPYPILTRAVYVARAQVHVEVGGGLGTR